MTRLAEQRQKELFVAHYTLRGNTDLPKGFGCEENGFGIIQISVKLYKTDEA